MNRQTKDKFSLTVGHKKGPSIMNRSSAWLCGDLDTPIRLEPIASISSERLLEDWVEADPDLLGNDYVVVGRQVTFEGGPADLVAIDPQGRWVVVEIKRSSNYRQDIAQALDYAASLRKESQQPLRQRLGIALEGKHYKDQALARIDTAFEDDSNETREVAVLLLGIGTHSGTERIREMLSELGVDVRIVSLDAYQDSGGRVLLTRDDVESHEALNTEEALTREEALDSIRQRAKAFRVLEQFDRWLEACESAGLGIRAYKHSVMITPPTHYSTFLMVGRPLENGSIRMNHGADSFNQWFPWIPENDAIGILGASQRGAGENREGRQLNDYLSRVEEFMKTYFPPPEGFVMNVSRQRWTHDGFLATVIGDRHSSELMAQVLSEAKSVGRVDFGSGVMGQAHLAFTPNGPHILQLNTGRRVRGMWSLGTESKTDSCWSPLKEFLSPFGGLTKSDSAPSVPLSNFSAEKWTDLIRVSKTVGHCFQRVGSIESVPNK